MSLFCLRINEGFYILLGGLFKLEFSPLTFTFAFKFWLAFSVLMFDEYFGLGIVSSTEITTDFGGGFDPSCFYSEKALL